MKVRIAVKKNGLSFVSEQLDQDVRSIASEYAQTEYKPNLTKCFPNVIFSERQCNQNYL